jgi:hypothetical protein
LGQVDQHPVHVPHHPHRVQTLADGERCQGAELAEQCLDAGRAPAAGTCTSVAGSAALSTPYRDDQQG